mmetsp:Transcript_13175/g.24658  ORF Transcript_13175/g.24658 Transcript_13175/m.24658 type:complete len:187 (-) Transcript_13175:50-610(-)
MIFGFTQLRSLKYDSVAHIFSTLLATVCLAVCPLAVIISFMFILSGIERTRDGALIKELKPIPVCLQLGVSVSDSSVLPLVMVTNSFVQLVCLQTLSLVMLGYMLYFKPYLDWKLQFLATLYKAVFMVVLCLFSIADWKGSLSILDLLIEIVVATKLSISLAFSVLSVALVIKAKCKQKSPLKFTQ